MPTESLYLKHYFLNQMRYSRDLLRNKLPVAIVKKPSSFTSRTPRW
jgi:hypothetical protein